MTLSHKYFPAAYYFILAALSVAASLLLAFLNPDVGKAPNPFITLAIYILPVIACMLIANAVYVVFLNLKGLPTRNLAEALVQRALRHWQCQDARRIARESSQLEDDLETE